jgi:hypothetical protein
MSTPYIGFSNETLAKCPPAKAGDKIDCPHCGDKHILADSDPPMMLSFTCGEKVYIAGLKGRLTMGVKADVSGKIADEEEVEVENCPFCSGRPRMFQYDEDTYGIGCSNPECTICLAFKNMPRDVAMTLWNTRVYPPTKRGVPIWTRADKTEQAGLALLLGCPFCGWEPIVLDKGERGAVIACGNEHCKPTLYVTGEFALISEAWNARAEPQTLSIPIEDRRETEKDEE